MRTALIIAVAGVVVLGAVWWITHMRTPITLESDTATAGSGISGQVERLQARRHAERPGWSGTTEDVQRDVQREPRLPANTDAPVPRRRRDKPAREMARAPLPEPGEAEVVAPATTLHPPVDFAALRSTALNDRDRDRRIAAIESVGDLDDTQALDVLTIGLNDRDSEVRLAALNELWLSVDDPPLDVLGPVLDDADPEVRLEALRMIGESEDPRARALVERALSDPDEDVSDEARDIRDFDLDDE